MKLILNAAFLVLSQLVWSQDYYNVLIDLTKTKNDKVPVEIIVPSISSEEIEFHMAKVVPGTYSISDFGRFVDGLQAFNHDGDELDVKPISTNKWKIESAQQLHKITYWINDSFDDFPGYGRNRLFEPGGTSIEEANQVFVMNTFGFIGYLKGLTSVPYELEVIHPENIYGATSLKQIKADKGSDIFTAENFNFLADAPILYSKPDTTSLMINDAKVTVAVSSPTNKISSEIVMDYLIDLIQAQTKYLGGKLPVDRYFYLIYLFDSPSISGAWGALEHSYSSLYTLPEMNPKYIKQSIRDVAAHEFFHIVTPLNIHSEEIHFFDYIDPKMSEHLWLYEGVTEYASHHVQVNYGLYNLTDFLNEIKGKIQAHQNYNVNIPYTDFSRNILEPSNEAKFNDVYSGGALIAMCLDLILMKSTGGEMDLQLLLKRLSEKYGPYKPFKDSLLFDEIEALSTREAGEFMRNHVGDIQPLPLTEVLNWVGIDYQAQSSEMIATTGMFSLNVNDEKEIYVSDISEMNNFGKKLGLEVGDVLLSWNEEAVALETINQIFKDHYQQTTDGDKITVTVRREVNNKTKEVRLKAKAQMIRSRDRNVLKVIEKPTEEQLELRKRWLGIGAES